LAEKCELYIQIVVNDYVKLARYDRKRATQREAELCGLSTHQCHHFPENSLAEIAIQTQWIDGGTLTNGRLPTKGRDSRLRT